MSPALAQPLRPPSPGRAVLYVGLFVLGAVLGVAGALVQPAWFPGGLLLALAAEAGLCVGAGRAVGRRGGAAAPALGGALAVVLLTTSRPEGDFLFAAGAGSYLFLLGGIAVSPAICATLAPVRQPDGGPARLRK
ncbi:Integral membrane protein OS=Streptomyces tendae OX=1932 GN=GUR47_15235 PE=4 SV=1 [Streptomyces tendae]